MKERAGDREGGWTRGSVSADSEPLPGGSRDESDDRVGAGRAPESCEAEP